MFQHWRKWVFMSKITYTRQFELKVLDDVYMKVVNLLQDLRAFQIDNTNIRDFNLFQDVIHPAEYGK